LPLFWTPSGQCDDGTLRDQLDSATTSLGFEVYGLVTWFPLSATNPTPHLLTNADERWQAVILKRDIGQARAIVDWCKTHHEPIVWSADAMPAPTDSNAPNIDGGTGRRHRWSQGVQDALGVDGMLTLSRAHPISDEEAREKRFTFRMMATKAHQRWLARIRARTVAELPDQLTAREIEVLRWFADGKIAEDVATLLNIKLTTVRFHATNAARKLGAENTTSAAYRALVLGLLHRPTDASST
jgi:LuxR family transcriptional regulator